MGVLVDTRCLRLRTSILATSVCAVCTVMRNSIVELLTGIQQKVASKTSTVCCEFFNTSADFQITELLITTRTIPTLKQARSLTIIVNK